MILPKQSAKSLALFLLTLLLASLSSVSAATEQQPLELTVIEKSWEIHRGDLPSGSPAGVDGQKWAPYVFSGRPEHRDADNHIIWLRVPLPHTNMQDPVLLLVSVEQSFQAFIDNTEIYQFGHISAENRDFFAGYRWHRIPLGENLSTAGKTLYLHKLRRAPGQCRHRS